MGEPAPLRWLRAELEARQSPTYEWRSWGGIVPPGFEGIVALFVWIGAVHRLARGDSVLDVQKWAWINGMRNVGWIQ